LLTEQTAARQCDPDHAANSPQWCNVTARQIAEALNVCGISVPRGGQWHATSVRNVMARA
jgi:hypothetical protein